MLATILATVAPIVPLPARTSLIIRLLFEPPPGILLLLLLAGGLLLLLHRRRKNINSKRLLYVGAILLGLSAALYLIGAMNVTDRERMTAAHQFFLHFATGGESDKAQEALEALLTDDARLYGPDGKAWLDRQGMIQLSDQWRPVLGRQVDRHLPVIFEFEHRNQHEGVALLEVHTIRVFEDYTDPGAVISRWLIRWRQGQDERWQVAAVQWLELNDQMPEKEHLLLSSIFPDTETEVALPFLPEADQGATHDEGQAVDAD